MSTIADMVERMLAAGVAADIIVLAVRTAERASADSPRINPPTNPPTSADSAAEKRRAYDRERQRIRRQSADSPPTSAESADSPLSKEESLKERKRSGERISADWKPSEDDLAFATEKGLTQSRIDIDREKFKNYWMAKTGAAATKLDWSATWRNWVLSSLERVPGTPPSTVVQMRQPEHGEPTQGGQIYLMDGTPERDAWDQFDRAAGKIPRPRDRRGGWNYPTRWPDEAKRSSEGKG